jgi:hypothetical protein
LPEPGQKKNYMPKPFSNIESITIERFYVLHSTKTKSSRNKNAQHRIVILGRFTVDLTFMKMFPTNDQENTSKQYIVFRGNSHHRPRPDDGSRYGRFSSIINRDDSFTELSYTKHESCFLGNKWL